MVSGIFVRNTEKLIGLILNNNNSNNNNNTNLFTAIWLSPGGSGYFTCKQNMKLVTTKFKSGGLHEKREHDSYISIF